MRARHSAWRQPNAADCSPALQLRRKLAGYWVNSVEQEQARRAHDHNPDSPNKGETPAPGALPPNPASTEMQNLSLTVPGLSARECVWLLPDKVLPDKPNRAHRLAGNRRGRS